MSDIASLFQLVGLGLIVLLPLANPLTAVALMLGLASHMTVKERNHQSLMAGVYVFIIMACAFYFGQIVMHTFGISIPGLRIAGGLIVTYIGFRMLFPDEQIIHTPEVESKKDEMRKHSSMNIAFIPLAMPGTAGPGTIAMIVSGAATLPSKGTVAPWAIEVAPVLVFLIISIILWLSLRSANFIMRLVGTSGIETISRLMGFLLVCMGIQFGINGIIEIVLSLKS